MTTISPGITLKLPATVGLNEVEALMMVAHQIRTGTGDVELDCSTVSFFDPFGLAVLAAAIETMADSRRVSMLWLSLAAASYLDRMDFFARRHIEGVNIPPRVRNDLRHTLMEITVLRDQASAEAVADSLANAIVGMIINRGANPLDFENPDVEFNQYYDPIKYAVSELVVGFPRFPGHIQ